MTYLLIIVATVLVYSSPTFAQSSQLEAPVGRSSPSPQPANQLRFELGIGAPAGAMAMRYSRVLPTRTRIEPGFGLGQTGYLTSLLITQPVFEYMKTLRNGRSFAMSVELYGGYGLSILRDGSRHPFTGREQFFPEGDYHWLDTGMSIQANTPWFVATMGFGATFLMSSPDGVGGDNVDNELFWWLFPEGWYGKEGYSPSFWVGMGWGF